MHKQKWVKVNAPVDEGMADLIEALSAFPKLQTIESCEGDSDIPAWVCFTYGEHWENPWRDIAEFVLGQLGPGLAQEVGDSAYVSLQVKETGLIQGEISVRPKAMQATVRAIRGLRKKPIV